MKLYRSLLFSTIFHKNTISSTDLWGLRAVEASGFDVQPFNRGSAVKWRLWSTMEAVIDCKTVKQGFFNVM